MLTPIILVPGMVSEAVFWTSRRGDPMNSLVLLSNSLAGWSLPFSELAN